jgi:hypothetical protein
MISSISAAAAATAAAAAVAVMVVYAVLLYYTVSVLLCLFVSTFCCFYFAFASVTLPKIHTSYHHTRHVRVYTIAVVVYRTSSRCYCFSVVSIICSCVVIGPAVDKLLLSATAFSLSETQ